ncbi:MAG: SCO family protein [Chloroflexota bacterium]
MPWIIFGRDEDPAPTPTVAGLDGQPVDLSAFRGKTALAMFFFRPGDCPECWQLVERLKQAQAEIRTHDAEPLVVLPELPTGAALDPARLDGLTVLVDREGRLTRQYHAIFEFDTANQPMLFVLNRSARPFRAYVDPSLDPEALMPRLLKYLEANALLCPE